MSTSRLNQKTNVQCDTNITKLIHNLLEGLGLQWRTNLFVNSKPYFWSLFQKLCITFPRNKFKRLPYLIIMSWEASENWEHHNFSIDIWYLVIWKAVKTRRNMVTRPEIEISWSMLPFLWGDLPPSQALGKNYKKIMRKIFKVTKFWGLQWNQLHGILALMYSMATTTRGISLPAC